MSEGFLSSPALDLGSHCSVLLSQMAMKVRGHNTVNKPDDLVSKPDLVHFKTRVGYFALVWGN